MKNKALLIGVNDYHLLGKLKYAKQDAEAFSEALQDYCGFDKDEISVMSCDAPGTMLAQSIFIERALAGLIDYRNLDLLVFGFWGHGFAPEAGKRYLCGTHTMESELERTAVSLDLVKAKLSQVGAENTLMILDCCQNSPGGRSAAAETLSRGEEKAFASIARDIQAAGRKKVSKYTVPTVAVLNACREGQKAYEWEQRKHGIFTAHLLTGLSTGCSGVAQLASSIFAPVAKTADELFGQEQTPYVVIEGKGDIILSPGKSKPSKTNTSSKKNSPQPPLRQKKAESQWWYTADDKTDKQISEVELLKLIKSGEIKCSTEVWREGLTDWIHAKNCPELKTAFPTVKPPKKKVEQKNGDIMTVPDLGMELIYVEPGSFMMGSDEYNFEQPIHKVAIRNAYWIGKYPVTQNEYQSIMKTNPSNSKGSSKPVEEISWNDALEFCGNLTYHERQSTRLPSGYEYRLLTEAEWEFAARGGTKSKGYKYSGSNNINSVAWHGANSDKETHDVGTKLPNELGIYDMSGNVWEWCLDDWHHNYKDAPIDGSRWSDGNSTDSCRVCCGGSWRRSAAFCRVSIRHNNSPGDTNGNLGFRVALGCILKQKTVQNLKTNVQKQQDDESVKMGKIYRGKVTVIKDFGAFVEIIPGREGLLHISEMADYSVREVRDICNEGDYVTVKLIDIDSSGKIRLSRKAALDYIDNKQL